MKLYPDPVKVQDEFYTGAALLLAEDDPAELLKLLDESVTTPWKRTRQENWKARPSPLMLSRFAGLGILVGARRHPHPAGKKAGRVFE